MYRYRLRPLAPFHVGEHGIGIEETAELPHSDTIFSAFVSAWRLMGGVELVEELLAGFPISTGPEDAPQKTPPVQLSSVFPYAGNVYFLPRPKLRLEGDGGDAKTGKKIEYVSWKRLQAMLHSAKPPFVTRDALLHKGQIWFHPADRSDLQTVFGKVPLDDGRVWYSGDAAMVPRVTIDRTSSASAIYFQGQVRFQNECGLYVLIKYEGSRAEWYKENVEAALALLGEQGLGGRRSLGLGRFEIEKPEEIELTGTGGAEDPHLVLCLYHPTWREVQDGILDGARYELTMRRGWLRSPESAGLRRKGLRMLTEGSIVSHRPTGDVVDVSPAPDRGRKVPHPVYRSGIALSVSCGRWQDV